MSSSPPIHAHTHRLSFSSSSAGSPTWYGSGPTSGMLSSAGYGYGYGSASGGGESRRISGSGSGTGFGFGAGSNGNGGVWGARYGGGSGGGGGNSNGNSGGNRSSGAGQGYDAAGQRRHEEELINAYEAEEERIINVLSKKLEKLREDKIDLENALEAESENHVNRMTRELSKLRQINAELEARLAGEATKPPQKGKEKEVQESALHAVKNNNLGGTSTMKNGESSRSRERRDVNWTGIVPPDPEPSLLLDALRRENEELRARLGKVEKDYARVKRLNEVYREELIVRRGRLGLPVDNLIGLTPSDRDPFEQPTHHRRESSTSPFPQRKNLASASHRAHVSPSSWSEMDVEGVDVEGRIGGTADDDEEDEEDDDVEDLDTGQNPGDYYNGSSTSYVPRFLSGRGGYASRKQPYRNNTTTVHGRGIPIRRPSSQTRIRRPNLMVEGADGIMGEHGGAAPGGGANVDELELPSTPVSPVVPLSSSTTSTSTSDSVSPFPFSPVSLRSGIEIGYNGGGEGGEGRGRSGRVGGAGNSGAGGEPASYVSTDVTSPESGPESFPAGLLGGLGALPGAQGQNGGVGLAGLAMSHTGIGGYGVPQRGLSYPSVPPPSLSSSLGSELDVLSRSNSRRGSNAGLGVGSRRGSNAGVGEQPRRVVETGSLRRPSASGGGSPQPLPIGGRVAETGTLLRNNRSRAGSLSVGYVPSTVDEGEETR